jgi:hypothetical protein
MSKAYSPTITIDAFNTGGLARKEHIAAYFAGTRKNPCDVRYILSKCPKWKKTEAIDAAWLMARYPILLENMAADGYHCEVKTTDVLNDESEGGKVAELTASKRKAHLTCLNDLDLSRQRFVIIAEKFLDGLEQKRLAKVAVAEEMTAKRTEEAQQKLARAEIGMKKKTKCANSAGCAEWLRVEDDEKWSSCVKCKKRFCPAQLCQTISAAHVLICKGRSGGGAAKKSKMDDEDDNDD